MIAIVKNILRFLGFDRAVSFGILARIWSFVAGPVTMLVIATDFSPEQQGFYYTFSSLLALQVFFDLGLMFVISQFASHEFVHLSWGKYGAVEGEPAALKRFTDLLCKTVRWFGMASLLMLIVLVPAGLIFFGNKGNVPFSWRLPWILAVTGTALNLFVTPFFAVMMGSGDVVTVYKRDLAGAVLSSCLCWIVIGLGGGLYAAFAVNLGILAIAWGYLIFKRPELVRLVWEGWIGKGLDERNVPGLSWWEEIWPMQWRMAISSGAAYFIFQFFSPVLFHYKGAVVAGQMGMTLSVANVLLAGGLTFIGARNPELAMLAARKNWKELDEKFFHTLKQTTVAVSLGSFVGVAGLWILQNDFEIGKRFLPAELAGLLFVSVIFNAIIGNFVIYIRSHKKDPLVFPTIALSIVQGVTTLMTGKYLSVSGVVMGYFFVTLFLLFPTIFYVWNKCRNDWHK